MSTATQIPESPLALRDVSPTTGVPAAARTRRRRLLSAAVFSTLLAAAFGVIVRTWPAMFSPVPERVIRASGRIEGRDVTLAAKTIQGRVRRLRVDEGQTVKAGEVLAELDAAQIEAQAAAADASVGNLDAQVRQAALDVVYTAKNSDASIAAAQAALHNAQAHVVRANAVLANATVVHQRGLTLFNAGAISKQELDLAEMARDTSRADLAAAEKDVARAEANVALAKASADTIEVKRQQLRALEEGRRTAAARLDEARANLAERLIIAPTNGTIISRPVEVGDIVSPGSPIFHLVDMDRLYVKVYIPEPDIAKLRLGGPAEITVDAFPGRRFPARISKIFDQAEFTPKNVETAEERLKLVFGVELAVGNADGVLKPGMPADCIIPWAASTPDGSRHGS